MMQKIQRFGGAMFTPVLLFAFAGVVVGVGTLCTTEAAIGPIAAEGTLWRKCWNIILEGGWTVFNQLPLLFAVSLPIGLARKQQARCCMEALVGYLTFCYFLSSIIQTWGPELGVDYTAEVGRASGLAMVAGIKTLDMGMIGALIISGVVIALHNKFFDVELPEWLGTFSGSTFVYMVSFAAMIPLAAASALVWPHVQALISGLQGVIMGSGVAGTGLFVFLERMLVPFGLHHLLYTPFYYDGVLVSGGIVGAWANILPQLAATSAPIPSIAPWSAIAATGWAKIFGIPGIAAAFYATAWPNKRRKLLALLIPVTLTAVLCGVTEPIEFTFLFVAPQLFVVHAALSAVMAMLMNVLGAYGFFTGGLIEMASLNFIPLGASHGITYLLALLVGLCFTGIYFTVMRMLILQFDFKTPGREDDEVHFSSKEDYRLAHGDKNALAARVVDMLGGADNIVSAMNCTTRLRIEVRDTRVVAPVGDFLAVGVRGVVAHGKAIQLVIGTDVTSVKECFDLIVGASAGK